MKQIFVPEMGDIIVGNAYCFTKEKGYGGTFKVAIKIERSWNDYETGLHYQGSIIKNYPLKKAEQKLIEPYNIATFSEFDDFVIIDANTNKKGKHLGDDFYFCEEEDDDF